MDGVLEHVVLAPPPYLAAKEKQRVLRKVYNKISKEGIQALLEKAKKLNIQTLTL